MTTPKIYLEPIAKDKLLYIQNNIETLVEGKEMACWLLGKWDKETPLIQDIVISQQEVGGADVDISEEQIIGLINEIGHQEANRIIGHWHIHPFAKGTTNWSSTDTTAMKELTGNLKKQRMVFLLSSLDTLKGTICTPIVTTTPTHSYEDVLFEDGELHTAFEEDKFKDLIQDIKDKVTIRKYVASKATVSTSKKPHPPNYNGVDIEEDDEYLITNYAHYLPEEYKPHCVMHGNSLTVTYPLRMNENDDVLFNTFYSKAVSVDEFVATADGDVVTYNFQSKNQAKKMYSLAKNFYK